MGRTGSALLLIAALSAAVARAQEPPAGLPGVASIPSGSATLDPEKQQRIWDHEHASFLLETYFGKPFNEALVARDSVRLGAMLREGFSAAVLDTGGEVRTACTVTERRRKAGRETAREVDAAGFVKHLLAEVAEFASVERTAFKVLFIHADPEREATWSATVRIEIGGKAAAQAPLEAIVDFEAVFVVPEEERLKAGERRLLARATPVVSTRRSSPRLLMEEVSESSGLATLPLPDNWKVPLTWMRSHRYQIAVEDYDRDGWLDIALGSTDGRPFLLRSLGGARFENVAEAVGLTPAPRSPQHLEVHALAGWIDFDDDGWPDLVLGPRLYRNAEGRRFVDVTQASGLSFDRVPFGVAVADFDADGLLDLYVVYQKGFEARPVGKRPWVGDPNAGTENHLWRNLGGGKFRNVTAEANAGGGKHQHFAASVFFQDDDPWPDLYLANDFGSNVLLRNRGDGTFEDVTSATGTGDYSTSMGVVAGDLDNDGSSELYIGNMYSKQGRRVVQHIAPEDYPPGIYDMIVGALAGSRLYRREPSGRYVELSHDLGINSVGWAYAPAMADWNADGWLDLFATAGYNSVDRTKPDG